MFGTGKFLPRAADTLSGDAPSVDTPAGSARRVSTAKRDTHKDDAPKGAPPQGAPALSHAAHPRHWLRARAENPLGRFIPFSSLVSPVDVITRGGDYLRVWRLDGV